MKPNTGETDKWAVNNSGSKTSSGKLFVTLPKGTTCDVTIYAAGSDKIVSNTILQQNFVLLPGSYDLAINQVKISGVPVENGSNTRLKAGVLRISNALSWTLYDESKENVLINSLAAGSWGLPVGKYILAMLGQDHAIEIKDGEMIDSSTTFK